MRFPAGACFVALILTSLALPDDAAAEPPIQRPFDTLLPWSLDRGQWEFGAGVVVREDVNPVFYADERSTNRDEWRVSVIDAAVGLGSGGEARIQFGVQHFDEEGGLEKTGIEDARLTFSWQLPTERYGSAAHLVVKLPNAGNDERLGTDQIDIFLVGSAGRTSPRWGWAGQLGFGILGSPTDAGVQDDLILFGAAAWMPLGSADTSKVTLFGEISGYAASRFGNDFRIARAGLRLFRRLPLDLSLRRGLTGESEDWGLELGLTLTAATFRPVSTP